MNDSALKTGQAGNCTLTQKLWVELSAADAALVLVRMSFGASAAAA